MRRAASFWTVLILCLAIAPSGAQADTVKISGGVSLDFLDGQHETGTAVDRLNFVPLPLADLEARYRRAALHIEGSPPLTFSYGSEPAGRQSTELSVVNVVLRESVGGGAFIGAGQTVYNQLTTYPAVGLGQIAEQGSRVTGLRIEAGIARSAFGKTHLEYVFAANPTLHGVEKTRLREYRTSPEVDYPERAVQVDTALRFITELRHGGLIYGVRYLNYASRYDLRGTRENGLLADRNAGVMPLVGYRLRL